MANRALVRRNSVSDTGAVLDPGLHFEVSHSHSGEDGTMFLYAPDHGWIKGDDLHLLSEDDDHDVLVKCLHDFSRENEEGGMNFLDLKTGELILVSIPEHNGWYHGIKVSDGSDGFFPSSYAEIVDEEEIKKKMEKEKNSINEVRAEDEDKPSCAVSTRNQVPSLASLCVSKLPGGDYEHIWKDFRMHCSRSFAGYLMHREAQNRCSSGNGNSCTDNKVVNRLRMHVKNLKADLTRRDFEIFELAETVKKQQRKIASLENFLWIKNELQTPKKGGTSTPTSANLSKKKKQLEKPRSASKKVSFGTPQKSKIKAPKHGRMNSA